MTVGFVGAAELAVLRDGRWVQVCPVRPEDEEQIVQFLRGLSVDAIYSRFFIRCPDLAREAPVGDTGPVRWVGGASDAWVAAASSRRARPSSVAGRRS